MQLAKDWGATDYDEALDSAVFSDHPECMQLAKDWGATDYNGGKKLHLDKHITVSIPDSLRVIVSSLRGCLARSNWGKKLHLDKHITFSIPDSLRVIVSTSRQNEDR